MRFIREPAVLTHLSTWAYLPSQELSEEIQNSKNLDIFMSNNSNKLKERWRRENMNFHYLSSVTIRNKYSIRSNTCWCWSRHSLHGASTVWGDWEQRRCFPIVYQARLSDAYSNCECFLICQKSPELCFTISSDSLSTSVAGEWSDQLLTTFSSNH